MVQHKARAGRNAGAGRGQVGRCVQAGAKRRLPAFAAQAQGGAAGQQAGIGQAVQVQLHAHARAQAQVACLVEQALLHAAARVVAAYAQARLLVEQRLVGNEITRAWHLPIQQALHGILGQPAAGGFAAFERGHARHLLWECRQAHTAQVAMHHVAQAEQEVMCRAALGLHHQVGGRGVQALTVEGQKRPAGAQRPHVVTQANVGLQRLVVGQAAPVATMARKPGIADGGAQGAQQGAHRRRELAAQLAVAHAAVRAGFAEKPGIQRFKLANHGGRAHARSSSRPFWARKRTSSAPSGLIGCSL